MQHREMATETSLVQINNAIVPVVHRKYQHVLNVIPLVPLEAVRQTFGPLPYVNRLLCTESEARALNKCCQQANVNLTFDVNSQLIHLDCLLENNTDKVVFSVLPNELHLHRVQQDVLDLRTEKKKEEASKSGQDESDKESIGAGHHEQHKCTETCQREPTERQQQRIDQSKWQLAQFQTIDIIKKETDGFEQEDLVVTGPQTSHTSSAPVKKEACARKRKPFVIKKTIFGKKIACLLRKEEYFVFLEQLHRCFFFHVNFVKFVFIVSRLESSIVDLSHKERGALPRCFGDIKCGQMIELFKVKCLLVRTKAILEKSKSMTESTDSEINKNINGKGNQHNQSAEGNAVNILLAGPLTIPIVISASGVILNIVPRVDLGTAVCSSGKPAVRALTSQTAIATAQVTTTTSDQMSSLDNVYKDKGTEVNWSAEEEGHANHEQPSRREDLRRLLSESTDTAGSEKDSSSTSRTRKQTNKQKTKTKRLMDAVEKLAKRKRAC